MSETPMTELVDSMPAASSFADQIPIPAEALAAESSTSEAMPDIDTIPGSEFASQDDTVFNPDIHVPGPTGMGIKTKLGKYRRKPGRKKGAVSAPNLDGTINTPGNVQTGDVIDGRRMQAAKAAAQIAVAATFIMGQVICGQDGAPIIDPANGINEPAEMEQAYTQAFYLSENPPQIPPWVLVAIVVGNYSARRLSLPTTQTRIGTMWHGVKRIFIKGYLWVTGKTR